MENSKSIMQDDAVNPIVGELIVEGDNILVRVKVPVESLNFKPVYKDAYLINEGKRGLVFRYYDFETPYNSDEDVIKEWMDVDFSIKNCHSWTPGLEVRVMCINESSSDEFRQLDQYFIERLEKFGYRKNVLHDECVLLNRNWNIRNPKNPVYPESKKTESLKSMDIPRRTKDDGILTLL